jgi:glutathione synthase/RimK-type ligase-like ATP-grasp enzyme
MVDITVLTDRRYYEPETITPYIQNILDEYNYLKIALEELGFSVNRTFWDNEDYDWTQTKAVVFRTVWDYFERIDEFQSWLQNVNKQTILINSLSLVQWNIDKHYLRDLSENGIAIVPTHYVDRGKYLTLASICEINSWQHIVIKPAISGAAFHTYKIMASEIEANEELFTKLVSERDMLVQEYLPTISTRGEASLMVFNGEYTHSILKKAKIGDFRVQDDFGGTVHPYEPTSEEIRFAEKVFAACDVVPAYGRADIVWDEEGNHLLSELEIIEPELWVRNNPSSAKTFALGIKNMLELEANRQKGDVR